MKHARRHLFALAGFLLLFSAWVFRVGPDVEVSIPPNTPAAQMGGLLKAKGVILSPLLFRVLAKASGLDRSLKPGNYHLRKNMSSLEALWRIHRGSLNLVRVTVPEGWRATQVAERLEDLGIAPADAFMDLVQEGRLEGYLYPTTYFFERATPPERVVETMHDEFVREVGSKLSAGFPPLLTPDQVVILASIVEREAVKKEEKPLIARVYLNRLTKKWALDADPTIQYALGYWKRVLSYKDLAFDSPFNTYTHTGLPPAPICSPGLESIQAVLSPAQSDAMYFVADNSGGHAFVKTFREHQAAKRKMKAARRSWRRQHAAELRRIRPQPSEEEDEGQEEDSD